MATWPMQTWTFNQHASRSTARTSFSTAIVKHQAKRPGSAYPCIASTTLTLASVYRSRTCQQHAAGISLRRDGVRQGCTLSSAQRGLLQSSMLSLENSQLIIRNSTA